MASSRDAVEDLLPVAASCLSHSEDDWESPRFFLSSLNRSQ